MKTFKKWRELRESDDDFVVRRALRFIMTGPHPPQSADQAEEIGRNLYFNSQDLRQRFGSNQKAGRAIRAAFEELNPEKPDPLTFPGQ